MSEYQDLWNSLRDYLERNSSDYHVNVSRVIIMMDLMEKARIGE